MEEGCEASEPVVPIGPATTIEIFDFMAGGRGSEEVDEEEVEETERGRLGLGSGVRPGGSRQRSSGEAGEIVGDGATSSLIGCGAVIVSKLLTTLEVKSNDEPEEEDEMMIEK